MRALHYLKMSFSSEMEHFHQVEKRHTIDLDLQHKEWFVKCSTYRTLHFLNSIITSIVIYYIGISPKSYLKPIKPVTELCKLELLAMFPIPQSTILPLYLYKTEKQDKLNNIIQNRPRSNFAPYHHHFKFLPQGRWVQSIKNYSQVSKVLFLNLETLFLLTRCSTLMQ